MRKIFNIALALSIAVVVVSCAEKEVKQAPLPQYSVEKPELRDIVYHLAKRFESHLKKSCTVVSVLLTKEHWQLHFSPEMSKVECKNTKNDET